MAEAQVREHRDGCQADPRTIYRGYTDTGREFVREYHLQPQFPIDCLGCCLHYLETVRNYRVEEGLDNAVYFTRAVPLKLTQVQCIARKSLSPAGQHGQIATGNDRNLGFLSEVNAVSKGCTYQVYSPAEGGLSIGISGIIRMECMAINQAITHSPVLADIYANYADATLIELYRQARGNLASLEGVCTLKKEEICDVKKEIDEKQEICDVKQEICDEKPKICDEEQEIYDLLNIAALKIEEKK